MLSVQKDEITKLNTAKNECVRISFHQVALKIDKTEENPQRINWMNGRKNKKNVYEKYANNEDDVDVALSSFVYKHGMVCQKMCGEKCY